MRSMPPMAVPRDGEDVSPPPQELAPVSAGVGVIAKLEEQWRKTKEHAETYPYVWSCYILVYGGLGAYLTWRWRELRRTEDRVWGLQAHLQQLAADEESQVAFALPTPPPPPQQPPPAGLGKPASTP